MMTAGQSKRTFRSTASNGIMLRLGFYLLTILLFASSGIMMVSAASGGGRWSINEQQEQQQQHSRYSSSRGMNNGQSSKSNTRTASSSGSSDGENAYWGTSNDDGSFNFDKIQRDVGQGFDWIRDTAKAFQDARKNTEQTKQKKNEKSRKNRASNNNKDNNSFFSSSSTGESTSNNGFSFCNINSNNILDSLAQLFSDPKVVKILSQSLETALGKSTTFQTLAETLLQKSNNNNNKNGDDASSLHELIREARNEVDERFDKWVKLDQQANNDLKTTSEKKQYATYAAKAKEQLEEAESYLKELRSRLSAQSSTS